MKKNYHVLILESETEVDLTVKIAANHRLQCLYKIGVYGKERQHELYVIGGTLNYYRFLKELKSKDEK